MHTVLEQIQSFAVSVAEGARIGHFLRVLLLIQSKKLW